MTPRLVSSHFPYIPIQVHAAGVSTAFAALLDTGFEGDVIVPRSFEIAAGERSGYTVFALADGSNAVGSVYRGEVEIGELGRFPARIATLGDECLLGRRLSDRFTITLDHGRRLIVEP